MLKIMTEKNTTQEYPLDNDKEHYEHYCYCVELPFGKASA